MSNLSRSHIEQHGLNAISQDESIPFPLPWSTVVTNRLHSSYERGCQEKKHLPAPRKDAGVVTYIQPHLILRGVIGLVALARRTF